MSRRLDVLSGWGISAGIHLVLLLAATLVYMERLLAVDGVDLRIVQRAPHTPFSIDYPRDIIERRSFIPAEEEAIEHPDNFALFDFDWGSKSFDSEEPGGGAQIRPLPASTGAVWGLDAERRIRRHPDPAATNLLRTGLGAGYGQRSENGAIREHLRRTSCCRLRSTESAVDAALKWLARHQNPDGSWSAAHFGSRCGCSGQGDPGHDVGVTSLSLLAFLGAGFTHLSKGDFVDDVEPQRKLSYGEVVKHAIRWLADRQNADGGFGEPGPKHLYDQAIAALALSEAYGMTAAPPLHESAQKAIDFLVAAQNPGKGWRYSPRSGENDTSVTGWAIMALKSAELSELTFPRSAVDGALAWLDEATESGSRRTGYTGAGTGKVYIPGRNEHFDDHPTMTAVSVLSRIFLRKKKRKAEGGGVTALSMDLPQWEAGKVDFYYWYYGSLALFQVDGPQGGLWSRWNMPMKDALVPNQKKRSDGCPNGSWDPSEDRWGGDGGRVYATAINCLTLEVFYRYASVFGTHP